MSTPMLPATTPTPPAASAAAEPAAGVAADDFLLMLGQLLGAPVAQATAAKTASVAAADGHSEATQALQDAAALTGVPTAVMVDAQVAQTTAADGGPAAGLLALPATASASRNAGTVVANEALAGALLDSMVQEDSGSSTAPNPLQAQTLDAAQLRATATLADTGPTRTLHQSVGTSAWADELGTRMLLMSERGHHSASLRLSPEHLGPLEVRIAIRDDQASVWFGSAHADTRAAIEQALPRLRELFASQGLSLADAGVHHETPREQPKPTSSGSPTGSMTTDADPSAAQVAVKLGLVDAYA